MSNKAFIFDLDGVIVDTAKYHYLAWRELANQLGFDFSHEQNELLKGVSRVRSLEILLDIGKVQLEDDEKEKYLHEKNEQYLKYIAKMNDSEILPGIDSVLHYLKKEKIPFALGSASKNARLILKTLNLLDLFDAIVDGNDVSTAKPDPEVFLIGAEKLGIPVKECIVVEDAKAGIEAAARAGMTSIGIGDPVVLEKADYNLINTNELTIDFVKKLIA
ncbi:beta-phosphoglucomutase [Lutimonas zeaxanthinifaciens]|uniref:beta-phosphoglucomutase n=1 Tax=Lutimonas zeaxanthinifaciens TaxID=3060215 RepID=UPI00265CC6AA|nr:beta-phosphoglucomutase [Lutimonas sp. YSD2104]WKK66216.1 beta-phosphoglucomutase [Lutimonas sp. YSD2104]